MTIVKLFTLLSFLGHSIKSGLSDLKGENFLHKSVLTLTLLEGTCDDRFQLSEEKVQFRASQPPAPLGLAVLLAQHLGFLEVCSTSTMLAPAHKKLCWQLTLLALL